MDDDPVPRSFKGHTCTKEFILNTSSFKILAQKQKVPTFNSDNDSKVKIFLGEAQLQAPFCKKDLIIFFSNLIFNFYIPTQNILQFCGELQLVRFIAALFKSGVSAYHAPRKEEAKI